MLRCFLHAALCVGVGIATLVGPTTGHAQTAVPGQVPSQLTPPSLRPMAPSNAPTVVLPDHSAIPVPSGDSTLSVLVGDVELEGAFAELASASEAVIDRLRNRPLSVQQIYAAAAELERIYTEAGFVLARVVVPGGAVVLSGILARQAPTVAAAYEPWFEQVAMHERDGWTRIDARRRSG